MKSWGRWQGLSVLQKILFLCQVGMVVAFAVAYLLFAEELFRRNLSWRIRRPETAEPSEWELFARKAGWIALTLLGFGCYAYGLTAIV